MSFFDVVATLNKFHVTKSCTNCNIVNYQYSMKRQLLIRVKGFLEGESWLGCDWIVQGQSVPLWSARICVG